MVVSKEQSASSIAEDARAARSKATAELAQAVQLLFLLLEVLRGPVLLLAVVIMLLLDLER